MANFTPWKKYMLELVDEMIVKHGLTDPFLDVGCGSGDVTSHFVDKKGWRGLAIDPSNTAIEQSKAILTKYIDSDRVSVRQGDVSEVKEEFGTIFVFDVMEHIKDDRLFIQELRKKISPGGALILSVPIKEKEWRWDDEFYGHVRRYELNELFKLLGETKLEIIESWDCTFPFFWLMRRVYTRLFPQKYWGKEDKDSLTMRSASQSAWDQSSVINSIVEHLVWWRPLFFIQKKFKNSPYGCERLILTKLREPQ